MNGHLWRNSNTFINNLLPVPSAWHKNTAILPPVFHSQPLTEGKELLPYIHIWGFFHVKSYYTHMYYIKPYGPNSVCTSPLKLFAPFSPTPIIAPGNFLKDQQILCLQNFTQISYNDITQKKKAAVIQKLLHLRHWRSLRWTYSLGDVQKCLLTANKCCTLIFLR